MREDTVGWEEKSSKQNFNKASEKQVQERWFLYTQLSKERRAEFDTLEKKFIQDLQQKLHEQGLNKDNDVKQERETLIEKAIRDKHYRPEWARGSLIDEDHYQKLAEHNVIVSNREEIKRMQDQHIQSLETVLAKEGLYTNKGDSLLWFQKHFNERGLSHNHDQDQNKGRGR